MKPINNIPIGTEDHQALKDEIEDLRQQLFNAEESYRNLAISAGRLEGERNALLEVIKIVHGHQPVFKTKPIPKRPDVSGYSEATSQDVDATSGSREGDTVDL